MDCSWYPDGLLQTVLLKLVSLETVSLNVGAVKSVSIGSTGNVAPEGSFCVFRLVSFGKFGGIGGRTTFCVMQLNKYSYHVIRYFVVVRSSIVIKLGRTTSASVEAIHLTFNNLCRKYRMMHPRKFDLTTTEYSMLRKIL